MLSRAARRASSQTYSVGTCVFYSKSTYVVIVGLERAVGLALVASGVVAVRSSSPVNASVSERAILSSRRRYRGSRRPCCDFQIQTDFGRDAHRTCSLSSTAQLLYGFLIVDRVNRDTAAVGDLHTDFPRPHTNDQSVGANTAHNTSFGTLLLSAKRLPSDKWITIVIAIRDGDRSDRTHGFIANIRTASY